MFLGRKKSLATLPRLVEGKGRKDWYIYFQVRDPLTDKMKPIKVYRGFTERKSIIEKRDWGQQLVDEYTERLRSGWSPLNDRDDVIYSDNIEYENLTSRFTNIKKAVKNSRYFLSFFLEEKKRTLRENTYRTYTSKLRIFCNWIEKKGYGEYDVSAISNDIILKFFDFLVDKRKLDKLTIEKYIQILKGFFEYLKGIDRIRNNPVFNIPVPTKKMDKGARPIGKADMKLLLDLIKEHDPQLYLSCMFIYYLALRPGQEMRLLKIKDIDLYNNVVTVVDGQAKVMRRTIDIPKPLADMCEEFLLMRFNREYYVFGRLGMPGPEPTGKNTLRVRFNQVRKKLGLPDTYKYYSMKHTGGGNLLQSGATIEEIKNHFGHRSIETTDRYLRRHFGMRNKKIIDSFPKPY